MTENWDAFKIATDGVPMVDTGTGKSFVLRPFRFAKKPDVWQKLKQENRVPTKQDLFNYHWPQMKSMIWGDGLVANTDVAPRVIMQKKGYTIFILCEPKFGVNIFEKPTNLQTVFKKKLTK